MPSWFMHEEQALICSTRWCAMLCSSASTDRGNQAAATAEVRVMSARTGAATPSTSARTDAIMILRMRHPPARTGPGLAAEQPSGRAQGEEDPDTAMFDQLDYVYSPCRDVPSEVTFLERSAGARVVFAIDGMGSRVAMLELAG